HLAELIDRKLFTQQQHHLSFLVESEASLLEAFFRISFSRVIRPRTCSSSAIRACSAERAASPSKTRWARSRNAAFHKATRFGPRPCLRQASAWDWTPVGMSGTTRALTSAVNCRRVLIRFALRLDLPLHYAPVQFSGRTTSPALAMPIFASLPLASRR